MIKGYGVKVCWGDDLWIYMIDMDRYNLAGPDYPRLWATYPEALEFEKMWKLAKVVEITEEEYASFG